MAGEQRLAALEQQLQALNAALSAAATREGELRTEVVRLGSVPAGSTGATARSTGTIDTRSLGKPDHFDGDEKKWEDWKVVMLAYCSVLDNRLGRIMNELVEGSSRDLAAVGLDAADRARSAQLWYILVMLCRGSPLTLVTNAGAQEGFLAWEKLIGYFDPTTGTRQAGQLLALLGWSLLVTCRIGFRCLIARP
jgi:hypothetical protein